MKRLILIITLFMISCSDGQKEEKKTVTEQDIKNRIQYLDEAMNESEKVSDSIYNESVNNVVLTNEEKKLGDSIREAIIDHE